MMLPPYIETAYCCVDPCMLRPMLSTDASDFKGAML